MARPANPKPSDGRADRWADHRAARRAELLAGVVATVRERGPDIGMDDVAAVSGTAKPVFYRYFADKADLYLAVGRDVAERIAAQVVEAVDAQDEPRAMVAAGVETFLAVVERDPDLYRFVLQPPVASSAAADYSEVVGEHISSLIGDVMRAAGLDSGVAEPWGLAMVGAVRLAAERWLDTRTMSRASLAASLTDLLWSGASAAYRIEQAPVARLRPVEPRAARATPQ